MAHPSVRIHVCGDRCAMFGGLWHGGDLSGRVCCVL